MKFRHHDLIILAGVQSLLDQEGPGYDLHKLKTSLQGCRSYLKSEVFADCDHEYSGLVMRIDTWMGLSFEQVSSISDALSEEAERAGREALDLLLLGYPQRDLSLLLLDVIDAQLVRFTGAI